MSRKYKFGEKTGAYFISFATVYWIDVFTRDIDNDCAFYDKKQVKFLN